MDLLSVIRRWYHRDKLPIREIRRRTGLSRNTIRKYLANGEVSPTYPVRKSVSKLDPFAELPKRFKRLQNTLIKQDGGDREMADILALVLHHDEKLVEQAVREAIASGIISKTHILNRLSWLLDSPPPASLEPPPALSLQHEPVANTERYDNLRENPHVG